MVQNFSPVAASAPKATSVTAWSTPLPLQLMMPPVYPLKGAAFTLTDIGPCCSNARILSSSWFVKHVEPLMNASLWVLAASQSVMSRQPVRFLSLWLASGVCALLLTPPAETIHFMPYASPPPQSIISCSLSFSSGLPARCHAPSTSAMHEKSWQVAQRPCDVAGVTAPFFTQSMDRSASRSVSRPCGTESAQVMSLR